MDVFPEKPTDPKLMLKDIIYSPRLRLNIPPLQPLGDENLKQNNPSAWLDVEEAAADWTRLDLFLIPGPPSAPDFQTKTETG